MTDQTKIERILRMMKMLTTNVNYSIDDIADKLELTQRTVYRYLDTLENAGFVLQRSKNVFVFVRNPLFQGYFPTHSF